MKMSRLSNTTALGILLLVAVLLIAFSLPGCGGNDVRLSESVPGPVESSEKDTLEELTFHDTGRFGALIGPAGNTILEAIANAGIGWVRPHPGPFVWNSMQSDKDDEVDFSSTDALVREIQSHGLNLLVTIWPYASWDQLDRPDPSDHLVSENDVFASELPLYRGNPVDWEAYDSWLSSVVERYDGDGEQDMEGLLFPVRYWEVLNEPDIGQEPGARLTFYRGGPDCYAELLQKSHDCIEATDPDSQVLIAGAAGGSEEFLDFWRRLFELPGVGESFDVGNVHCISHGHASDLNVSPYRNMLESSGLSKPIWVTEAENIQGGDEERNAERLESSVAGAIQSGAEKIFFTNAPLGGDLGTRRGNAFLEDEDVYRKIVDAHEETDE